MKILNLDKLAAKSSRQIVMFGKTHTVEEMTVANFIETTSVAEKMVDASLVEQVKETIEMIVRSIPTADRADLAKLPLEQLQTVVSFIRGDVIDGVETAEDDPQKK